MYRNKESFLLDLKVKCDGSLAMGHIAAILRYHQTLENILLVLLL